MANDYANSVHTVKDLDDALNKVLDKNNGIDAILEKLKNTLEAIQINTLSDLDNYKLSTHRGVFNVFRGNIYLGVLFIIQYQAPQHGGLQVFLSTFEYKMSGSSSLSMFSIIYRSTDYNNTEKWLEWKPYQTTFISNDGSVPENGAGIGLNDTNMSPSLNLFLKLSSYPKIVQWSGKVIEDAEVTSVSAYGSGEIYYISSKKTFAFKDSLNGEYHINFDGIEDFQYTVFNKYGYEPFFSKNIFQGNDGSIWIADSKSSIKKISEDAPQDNKTYGRSNNQWKQIESAGTVTIDAELNEYSSNAVRNSAITKGINAAIQFYPIPGDITSLIAGEGEDVVNKVRDVFGTIDGWFFVNQINKNFLIDNNGITMSFSASSVGAGNYQFNIRYYAQGIVTVELFARQITTSGPPTLNIERVTINKG